MSQHSQTSGFINTYHVSALAEHQLQRSMNESPVSTGAEAVLFNTMAALYVEVNLAYWPRLCGVFLMDGIQQ